uniref:Uncharacterized protein MANES_10G081700 n=1 Tax=Rhizophora mucronata TaxID=61149 RepID=A0A2P2KG97_RHIMU
MGHLKIRSRPRHFSWIRKMVFSFILSIRLLNRFFAHGTRLYLGIRFWSSLERQCILQLPFVPSIPICILSNIRTSLAEYSLHLWLPISPRPFRTEFPVKSRTVSFGLTIAALPLAISISFSFSSRHGFG